MADDASNLVAQPIPPAQYEGSTLQSAINGVGNFFHNLSDLNNLPAQLPHADQIQANLAGQQLVPQDQAAPVAAQEPQQPQQQQMQPQQAQPQIQTAPVDKSAFAPRPEAEKPLDLPKLPEYETLNKLEQAHNARLSGIQAEADAGAAKATATSNYLNHLDAEYAKRASQVERYQKDATAKADEQMNALKGIQQQLLNPSDSDKLNANRANPFVNGTTSQKLAAGIAVALGGIGGALTGKGGNVGLDMINKVIDRDIDAQKFNIERDLMRKRAGMEVSQNLLQDLHQQFGDKMHAETALRAIMLEKAKNQLDAIAGRYQAPEIKAKAQQLSAQLSAEQATQVGQLKQSIYQREFMNKLMQGQTSEDLHPQVIKMLPKEYQETYVPKYGFAPTKEDREAFQKTRAELEPLQKGISDAINYANSAKFNKLSPTEHTKMQTMIGLQYGPMRELMGFKSLTDADQKFLDKIVGHPESLTSLKSIEVEKLKTLLKNTNQKLNMEAKIRGLQPKNNVDLGFKPSR